VPDVGKVWHGPIHAPDGKGTLQRALYKQFEYLSDLVPLGEQEAAVFRQAV
jgi:hypothetical protein